MCSLSILMFLKECNDILNPVTHDIYDQVRAVKGQTSCLFCPAVLAH
jgi:hypothetical protein